MADDAHKIPTVKRDVDKVRDDARKVPGGSRAEGAGTVFTEPILVVNQKAKLIEVNNEYAIFDQDGTQIGAVRQVGQSKAKKLLRVVTNVDQFLTTKLEVVDMKGVTLLALTRPAKLMKSKVIVSDGSGKEIGVITQGNVFGKIHFSFDVNGQTVGSINAENWRAWNFNIQDANGKEVRPASRRRSRVCSRRAFTTADNYVISIPEKPSEPLLSLVVAAALCVDTALKQDSK